jgi:hypothetical protein
MYLQLAEGENNGNYAALAESGGVMDAYVFVPAGFLPEFDKDTYVRADYFNKFDPTTAEALINALISQQTVGLSVVGVAAVASGGLKLAKQFVENRKAKVAAGTAKPLFKPGGVFDKIKTKIQTKNAPANEEKKITLPTEDTGLTVQTGKGTFGVGFKPKPEEQEEQPSFFAKYKTPLLIGAGVLAVGGIYLATRKKKRR